MKDLVIIIGIGITFIIILKFNGYNNTKQEREKRIIENVDPLYDKKYPKKF